MTSPVPQKPVRAHQLEIKIDLNSSARVPPASKMKLVTVFALVNDSWIMNLQYSLVTVEISAVTKKSRPWLGGSREDISLPLALASKPWRRTSGKSSSARGIVAETIETA